MNSYAVRIRSGIERRIRSAATRLRGLLPAPPQPVILMYHRIAEESFDPWGSAVTPSRFAEQLAWLVSNRKVISLAEFAEGHAKGTLPADAAAITFDDGYSCNAKVAAPILERSRASATFFLPVEAIEKSSPFWWDELEQILLDYDGSHLSLEKEEFSIGSKHAGDRRWPPGSPPRTPRQRAYYEIQRRLVTKRPSEIDISMTELRHQARSVGTPAKGPMSPQEVRRTGGSLIEFGSHSLTHPWLSTLSREEKAVEICGSADRCAALTGVRPKSFAYPFGELDKESTQLARAAGYNCACSTENAAVEQATPLFALPRVQVGNWRARRLERALREL